MTSNIEPISKTGYLLLNPNLMITKYSRDFKRLDDETYTSNDARLINAARGTKMTLDNPPIDCSVSLINVNSPALNPYHVQSYPNYSTILPGQFTYYIDKSIEDAYFNPIFFNKAAVTKQLYVDPMNSTYTEYNRMPLIYEYNKNCIPKTFRTPYSGNCLSSIADINEQREDIMGLQMRPINRQKFFR